MSETVECDGCGRRVRLRRDDTYGEHGYMAFGTKNRCDRSRTPYSRHTADFRIIKRNPNVWLADCRCGSGFTGPEYQDVEGQWLEHCAEEKAGVR